MNQLVPDNYPWKRSRSGYAVVVFFSLVIACLLLRLVLFFQFGWSSKLTFGTIAQIFFSGLHQDFFVALITILPLLFWFWVVPQRWFEHTTHRVLFVLTAFLFWVGVIFLLFTEYYFFAEFKSRFNTTAVDYLLHPREVFGNIRASYPLYAVVGTCAGVSLVWCVIAFRYFRQMWFQPSTTRARFLHFVTAVFLSWGIWLSLNPRVEVFPAMNRHSISTWVIAHTETRRPSNDRVANEVANNGPMCFINAALKGDRDYQTNKEPVIKTPTLAQGTNAPAR